MDGWVGARETLAPVNIRRKNPRLEFIHSKNFPGYRFGPLPLASGREEEEAEERNKMMEEE